MTPTSARLEGLIVCGQRAGPLAARRLLHPCDHLHEWCASRDSALASISAVRSEVQLVWCAAEWRPSTQIGPNCLSLVTLTACYGSLKHDTSWRSRDVFPAANKHMTSGCVVLLQSVARLVPTSRTEAPVGASISLASQRFKCALSQSSQGG